MIESILAESIGGGILVAVLYLAGKLQPYALRYLTALWRRSRPALAAHWRKPLIALTVAWGVGALLSFAAVGETPNAAPVWALCWAASPSLIAWGGVVWLATR